MSDALLAQNALNTLDGVAFFIEQMSDALQQCDVGRTIITTSAGALHRLDLAEPGFPKSQHVLRQIQRVGGFADRAESIRTLHGRSWHDSTTSK